MGQRGTIKEILKSYSISEFWRPTRRSFERKFIAFILEEGLKSVCFTLGEKKSKAIKGQRKEK